MESEGIDFAILAVVDNRSSWDIVAPGFEKARFPILPDDGKVFSLYSAGYYDTFLIDKTGHVAALYRDFIGSSQVPALKSALRALAAE